MIDRQIEWTERQLLVEQNAPDCLFAGKPQTRKPLKWTGSIVKWVELIYALYTVKRINNGKISLKDLFGQMGEIFDFEVKEFANYFMNIKNRTDGRRTKFTDLLRINSMLRYPLWGLISVAEIPISSMIFCF